MNFHDFARLNETQTETNSSDKLRLFRWTVVKIFSFFLIFLSFSLLFFLSSISLGLNLATSGRAFEWNLNFACKFFLISRRDWFVNDKIIRIIGEVWNKIFWNKIMEIQYNFFDFNSYCFRSYLTTNYNYNSR